MLVPLPLLSLNDALAVQFGLRSPLTHNKFSDGKQEKETYAYMDGGGGAHLGEVVIRVLGR